MVSLLRSIGIWLLTAVTIVNPSHAAEKPSTIDYQHYISANSILMIVSNVGHYANDYHNLFGYDYGMFYPFSSVDDIINGSETASPLYSAGLWLGGQVAGSTRVAIADFSSEYWPGPIRSGTFVSDADTIGAYRLYQLYADSLESNPNLDYLEWPDSLGAPLDGTGRPKLRGTQTLWSVFNDANPATHNIINGSSSPLGIEIRQTTWASDAPGQERLIYIEYDLFNKGQDTISNLYIGAYYDPDLGGAEDDLTGCDSLSGMFYSYNATNADAVYGSTPPALGFKLTNGPVVPSPGDSARFFGRWLTGYRNLAMSSYIAYPNGDDPQSAEESYRLLQGLKRDGSPLLNGTKFSYPGDPVIGTGDLDPYPGNPHGIGSVGPTDFYPGDSQSVIFVIGVGQGVDRLSSITDLREILNIADSVTTNVPTDSTSSLPGSFLLQQNYPNPFNPATTIEYIVSSRTHVSLEIFNVLGRRVRTLVNGTRSAGEYRVEWNGTDDVGKSVSSGVYLYRFRAGDVVQTKRMMLLK